MTTADVLFAQYHRRPQSEADRATAAAVAVFDHDPDPEIAVPVIMNIVIGSTRRQSARADRFLADFITIKTEFRPNLLGIDTTPPPNRIAAALRTALDRAEEQARSTIRRIAHHESAQAGRDALTQAMRRSPQVRGWTRVSTASACNLCASLTDGKVIGLAIAMVDHPGCACVQQPILKGEIV